MKKVLLVLSVFGMLAAFSSCSRDCVCKQITKNADGDRVSKSKTVGYDVEDKDKCKDSNTDGYDKLPGGGEYKLKCHKTMF